MEIEHLDYKVAIPYGTNSAMNAFGNQRFPKGGHVNVTFQTNGLAKSNVHDLQNAS
jgi:hypothetical protein